MSSAPHSIIEHCARWILRLQRPDGAILWLESGIFDPWNHTESAMALAAAGHVDAARAAYDHLIAIQRDDGALPGQCGASVPLDAANRRLMADQSQNLVDTNFTGYCALGVWHLYQVSGDAADLQRYASLVDAAVGFVLAHQSRHGEIAWRAREKGEALEDVDALRSGNCALYKSLQAAICIRRSLGRPATELEQARMALGHALRNRPDRFDRTWPSKAGYAMDWYYPVLCGLLSGDEARAHLLARRDDFIDDGLGCRCVTDEPWTTVAETAELALALLALGERQRAQTLLSWCAPLRAQEGGYFMGWQSQEDIIWPMERPSWTAAAMVLAQDALHHISPAASVPCGALTPAASARPQSARM